MQLAQSAQRRSEVLTLASWAPALAIPAAAERQHHGGGSHGGASARAALQLQQEDRLRWTLAGDQLEAADHHELEWRYGQHLQHCQWPNATGQLELWEQPGPAPAQFDQQAV